MCRCARARRRADGATARAGRAARGSGGNGEVDRGWCWRNDGEQSESRSGRSARRQGRRWRPSFALLQVMRPPRWGLAAARIHGAIPARRFLSAQRSRPTHYFDGIDAWCARGEQLRPSILRRPGSLTVTYRTARNAGSARPPAGPPLSPAVVMGDPLPPEGRSRGPDQVVGVAKASGSLAAAHTPAPPAPARRRWTSRTRPA